ncbi:hypothetical protein HUN58_14505 [Curtobacterium sp. Csp1]|uniref:hypothetical protein n=1 Tax=unclassified Curtobacterium TaxID=257496 RepID=UPI0015978FF3|nr:MULTISPECIES: hypothetical protein [unclassified Curtobacterium]QKS13922.1 hypothetical protein HUN60_12940 [Curtobacterium sp. csp3]QKS20965.1 hypothetical protein HUN58_14505 [Curtobacterium sp. Csp1]
MTEPTVQMPVSLIEELREAADVAYKGPNDTDPAMLRLYADKIRRGYPGGGSNLTAAVARVLDVVADALVWQPTTTADQPRIEDLESGTLLELGKRWTVARDHDGVTFLYAENDGYSTLMPASAVDPSTIRDVTPPTMEQVS